MGVEYVETFTVITTVGARTSPVPTVGGTVFETGFAGGGYLKVVSMLLKKACCAAPDLVVDWKLAALDSPTDDRLVIRWEDAHCRRCRTEYEFDQIVRLDLTTLDVLVRMKKVM